MIALILQTRVRENPTIKNSDNLANKERERVESTDGTRNATQRLVESSDFKSISAKVSSPKNNHNTITKQTLECREARPVITIITRSFLEYTKLRRNNRKTLSV